MNRALLLTAAGLLSAALIGAGCEHDKSHDESARIGSARGETMQASGQPGIGAKRGTGTTASGEMTGNVTTGAPAPANTARPTDASASASAPKASASASVSASARDAGAPGQTNAAGHGPGGIDEQKTVDTTASATAAPTTEVKTTVAVPDGSTTAIGAGPAAVNEGESASGRTAAEATATAQPAAAEDKKDAKDDDDAHDHAEHADAWAKVKPSGAAPKDMQVTGTVKFAKADHGVKVMVDLKGLTPNGKHGFHVHEKSDMSDPKLQSVGPHFNPTGKKHGGPDTDERHGGDLGNLTADDKGNVKTTIMAHGLTIDGEKDGIVGRSIIVHAKPDDLKTDPSGNSGDRIAGGAIEKASKADKKSADAGAIEGQAQPAAAKGTDAGAGPAAVNESELNK